MIEIPMLQKLIFLLVCYYRSSWSKSSPSPPAHEAVVPRIPYKALQVCWKENIIKGIT